MASPAPPKTAEEKADEAIAQDLVPTDVYDWKPALTALFERTLEVDDLKPDATGSDPEDALLNDKGPKGDNFKPPEKGEKRQCIPQPIKKNPDGAWDYVWYIPGWTDPDFDQQLEQVPVQYVRVRKPERDVLQMLRPALRPADVVRNPTTYAKRWGIYPDRTDGRSRLSPSASTTRGVAAAMKDQIDRLDGRTKQELLRQTTEAAVAGQIRYPGAGVIAPEVFETYKRMNSTPTFDEIRNSALQQNIPFEQYVEGLTSDAQNGYQSIIQEIFDDEDYQRLLFRDMTTDELIRQNIHTMSEVETCDLNPEPLHWILEKRHWEDTTYRGASPNFPRFVYQLGSQRQEWDVHRNPQLWDALQPALQMVSRVLKTNPGVWQAIRDLRTRQKIDSKLDFRSEDEKLDSNTEYLTRMVPVEDIDMKHCWEPIQSLAAKGFDFVTAIDRLLDEHVCLAIGSGRMEPHTGEKCSWVYGSCDMTDAGADSVIILTISSELIWPLLIPDYSSSERLAASMMISGTILHELMHAGQKAVFLLTNTPEIHPPERPLDIVQELLEFGDISYDFQLDNGEPYWNKDPVVELGFACEQELFGTTLMSINEAEWGGLSDHIQGVPVALFGDNFPMPKSAHVLKDRKLPLEAYERGMPIDYFARFFTQWFWDEDVPKWGHTVFKQMPPDRAYFALMNPRSLLKSSWTRLLGDKNYRFIKFTLKLLCAEGFGILSEYCRAAMLEARGYTVMRERWINEMKRWEKNDPVDVACRELDDTIKCSEALQGAVKSLNPATQFSIWKASHPQDYADFPGETIQQWTSRVYTEWAGNFKQGGTLMRQVMALHTLLQTEVSHRQRWVFEFLSVGAPGRNVLFRPNSPNDPLSVLIRNRLDYYTFWTRYIASTLSSIAYQPEFATDAMHWMEWANRFTGIEHALTHLSDLIKQQRTIDDVSAKSIREAFATIPSSLWKSRTQRLKKLAVREYVLLDPRIRAVLDEFSKRISVFAGDAMFPNPPVDQDTWDQFERIKELGQANTEKLKERGKNSMFLNRRTEPSRPIAANAIHRVNGHVGKSRIKSAAKNAWNPGAVLGSKPPPRDAKPRVNVIIGDATFTVPEKFKSLLDLTVNVRGTGSTMFPNPLASRTTMTEDLVGITPGSATQDGTIPSFLDYRNPAAEGSDDEDL